VARGTRLRGVGDRRGGHDWRAIEAEDLSGRGVLLLGHGSIGGAVERRLAPFGVELTGVARRARPGVRSVEELPELLPDAEVLIVLLPFTSETEGLLDARMLARLPEGAWLINAARGRMIGHAALQALLGARGR